MKRAHETEARRRSHEWACKEAVLGCEKLRRAEGRWQVLVNGSWRDLDPRPLVGDPVK